MRLQQFEADMNKYATSYQQTFDRLDESMKVVEQDRRNDKYDFETRCSQVLNDIRSLYSNMARYMQQPRLSNWNA
jgi:hypothetical protein